MSVSETVQLAEDWLQERVASGLALNGVEVDRELNDYLFAKSALPAPSQCGCCVCYGVTAKLFAGSILFVDPLLRPADNRLN